MADARLHRPCASARPSTRARRPPPSSCRRAAPSSPSAGSSPPTRRAATSARPRAARTRPRRSAGCPASARARALRTVRTEASATRPPRRRATPRPRSSRRWRSAASAGPPRTPRRSAPSRTAATSRLGAHPELAGVRRHPVHGGALLPARRLRLHRLDGGGPRRHRPRRRAARPGCTASTSATRHLAEGCATSWRTSATSTPGDLDDRHRRGHRRAVGRYGPYVEEVVPRASTRRPAR